MIAYQVFEEKNHEGRYFKEWELPAGFPIPHDFVLVPPGADMKQPRFDWKTQTWVESEDDLLLELKKENESLKLEILETKQRALMTEEAILDLATMIIGV